MSGTENSILSNIPDFAEEHDASTTDTNTTTTTQQTGTDDTQRSTSAQPTGPDSTSRRAEQSTQQSFVRRHDGLREQPNADNPRVRDLVDPVTGKVVAQGGIERRVYEEGQRHARENNALKQQVGQLQGFVNSVNEVTREAARLNIKPEDQMVAMRVMADFLRDPVRTLQYLVEEVKAKGYPIPFLAEGVSPGMDMNAIARMIDQKMAPITQQRQQTEQQQQLRTRAEQELNGFLGDNPDAEQNLDVLGEMLQAQPGLTIHSAYTKMIRWSHEQGLDWTQPLKAQIAARQQQGQQPTHQQTQQTNQRPLPGSRSVGTAAQRVSGANGSGAQFNENASWAEIIRSSMEENNIRLN
jgi:hypothetical protein